MAKVKKNSMESANMYKPALTPEARENQLIALATDLAEQQLRDGTASSQLITEYVKRGSTKAKLEKEILEQQRLLMEAKTENLKSSARIESLFNDAIKAMKEYSGQGFEEVLEGDQDAENIF